MMTLTKISKILTQLPWIKGHFAVSKAQKKGSMGNYYTYTIVLHNLETRERVFQVSVTNKVYEERFDSLKSEAEDLFYEKLLEYIYNYDRT